MANTNTLQRSINYATILARGAPLSNVLAIANEPALTIGDYVRQFILSPPFSWRWNRSFTIFLATPGINTYSLLAWKASFPVQKGWITVDSNGNQQQVTIAGTTGLAQPAWSNVVNGTTVDGTVTWVNQGSLGVGATAIRPFGWLEKAVAIADDNSAYELDVMLDLGLEPRQNQLFKISPLSESSDGICTFRTTPAPERNYKIYLTQQNAAASFTSLADLWSPIPDYLSYLYNQGTVAKVYEYMNKETYLPEEQLFLRQVISANAGLTDSEVNIFLSDRVIDARTGQSALGNSQSGRQGRGLFGQ